MSPGWSHRNCVGKSWKLICAQGSQIIRESEDGLSSELCQKKELLLSFWLNTVQKPDQNDAYKETEGTGLDAWVCIRSPGSQHNHWPWGSLVASWTRIWASCLDCEVSPALSRLCWRPPETTWNLCHSIGCSVNWLTLRVAAAGVKSTVLYSFIRWERLQVWDFCRLGFMGKDPPISRWSLTLRSY